MTNEKETYDLIQTEESLTQKVNYLLDEDERKEGRIKVLERHIASTSKAIVIDYPEENKTFNLLSEKGNKKEYKKMFEPTPNMDYSIEKIRQYAEENYHLALSEEPTEIEERKLLELFIDSMNNNVTSLRSSINELNSELKITLIEIKEMKQINK